MSRQLPRGAFQYGVVDVERETLFGSYSDPDQASLELTKWISAYPDRPLAIRYVVRHWRGGWRFAQ